MKNIACLLLLFIGLTTSAQNIGNATNNKLHELAASLDSFRNRVPEEKVHIHFDKPFYSLGDTIWMKAYVVNEANELSVLSKLLYVDLVDENDSIKTSLRLPLTQGLGWGSVTLSDTLLHIGNYHLRAYTTHMRNFGEEYFFDKPIKIGNALPPAPTTAKTKSLTSKKTAPVTSGNNGRDNISVQFFPEGGELVNDLVTKVAFKAIGADGLSREISGSIVTQNNDQITTFQSEHAGMGTFTLQPDSRLTYIAVVKLPDGKEKRIYLPKAKDAGYGLTVTQTNDNLIVNIQASKSLLNTGEIALIAQSNNTVYYTGKKELANAGFIAVIPKSRFPEGIAQFTLFSPQYQPVAERIVFIRTAKTHLNIKISPDKPEYQKRNKVNLNVEVTDQDGKPVTGALSLAVTDEGKVPYAEEGEKTIFSNLLLSANLKGYIEYPNYYFTAIDADKDKQLDNLLLTQGWRRFAWDDLLNNNFPAIVYQPEKGRGISGVVLTDKKGKPVKYAKVTLLVNLGGGMILDTIANAEGRFNFDFPFAAGATYNLTATDAKNQTGLEIEIDKMQSVQPVSLKYTVKEETPGTDFTTYMENTRKRFDELKKYGLLGNGIQLKEVVINEYKKREDIKSIAVQNSSNLAGPGNADQVFTFVDLLSANNGHLGQWLDGRMVGVTIKTGKFGEFVPFSRANGGAPTGEALAVRAPGGKGQEKGGMTLVVDGINKGSNPADYGNLNVDDIASIEILRGTSAALYGLSGSAGVFIVTTKKGNVDYDSYTKEHYRPGSTKPKGLKTYTFQGAYDVRRQFYAPDYDNPATNKDIADLRSTIYWNPNIITDANGKASVNFFNADGVGNYRIIAEGLDGSGKLGRQVSKYVVK